MVDRKQYFEREYYSPKSLGSFGGIKRLYYAVKKHIPDIKYSEIQNWLNQQNTYTLFKQVNKKFVRLPILVNNRNEQWQIDLMDMSWLSAENDGYRYLFNVIDCFSRFVWVIPIKTKSSETIANEISKLLQTKKVPEKIQSDQGKEFKNSKFLSIMKKYKINYFTSTDDVIKCAIVERFNRTLRNRIYRFLSHNSTKRYIDVLQDIVQSYNNSFHRTIGMAPSRVNAENSSTVLNNIRKNHPKVRIKHKPFAVGDKVHISRAKTTFEKGATSNFTEEIFTIFKVKKTQQGYVYRLRDWSGEEITSIFYHNELVHAKEQRLYKIEKILRSRTNPFTKKKEYFVKWRGYPKKFNSWIQNVEST